MPNNPRILVIGGVACGPKAAARIKRLNPEAQVSLIDQSESISLGACGLPYYVEGLFTDIGKLFETPIGVKRTPQFFKKVKGFDVVTKAQATKIDRENKIVRVKYLDQDKEDELFYDKLVLATGSHAFLPPIPGAELKNIWKMKDDQDATSLVDKIQNENMREAVIIGAGLIGVEMAEALSKRGLKVTIIEMFDQILPQLLDKDIAMCGAKYLQQNGIQLALGQKVTALEGKDKVTEVKTEEGSFPADLVLISVGVRPNDILAREAGLECDPRGGIKINNFCQTSDPDIYAGGDCVVNNYIHPYLRSSVYAPMGSTANKHGRVIANNICGIATPFRGISNTGICKVFDYTFGKTGLTEDQARKLGHKVETIICGGPDKPHYMLSDKPLIIKMIASPRDRTLLGVQVLGPGEADKRLDVAASAIFFNARIDQLASVDLSYAPPFSPPIDLIATTANIMENKLDGIAKGIPPLEAKNIMDKNTDLILLDVRSPQEYNSLRLPDSRVINIPLGELRQRTDEVPRDKEILTFCKVSMRGYEAQRILQSAGIENVRFIEGGLLSWPFELWSSQ